jgi:hypothetical protein
MEQHVLMWRAFERLSVFGRMVVKRIGWVLVFIFMITTEMRLMPFVNQ